MKKIFLIVFIFSISNIFATNKNPSIPRYRVIKSLPDKSLKKTEAAFVLSFKADNIIAKQKIKLSYNGSNKTLQTDSFGNIYLKVKPGKYLFRFFYHQIFFEITTDSIDIKPGYRTWVEMRFQSSKHSVTAEKPVIYVYPEKTKQIDIKLEPKGELGFTYPAYNKGWNFIADSDGTIHMNDKKYHYLFWEGTTNINKNKINCSEGFMVSKGGLVPFFENSLSKMGLNSNEIEDYITYWVPIMAVNEYNYVHFIFNEEYNEYATLDVTPKPDNTFRVFMLWSKIDQQQKIILKEQTLPSFTRSGFTVVEWGGAHTTFFEHNALSIIKP